jgi:hypothetical protein
VKQTSHGQDKTGRPIKTRRVGRSSLEGNLFNVTPSKPTLKNSLAPSEKIAEIERFERLANSVLRWNRRRYPIRRRKKRQLASEPKSSLSRVEGHPQQVPEAVKGGGFCAVTKPLTARTGKENMKPRGRRLRLMERSFRRRSSSSG